MSYLTDVEAVITTVDIDTNVAAAYLVGTTAPGVRFCPLLLSVEPVVVSGTVDPGGFPTVSFGTNSPNYDNWFLPYDMNTITPNPPILNETLMTGVGGAGFAPSVPAGTDIYCNVTVASTGSTYTLRASLTGIYYED